MCRILAAFNIAGESPQKLLSRNIVPLETQTDGFAFSSDEVKLRSLKYEWSKALFNKYYICHTRIATTGAVTAENTHGYQIGDWEFFHNGWCKFIWDEEEEDYFDQEKEEAYWNSLREDEWDEALALAELEGRVDSYGVPYVYTYPEYTYPQKAKEKHSDSYLFFKALMKVGLSDDNLRACAKEFGFYGIGVLINRKANKYIAFNVDKVLHVGVTKDGAMVLASYQYTNKHSYFDTKGVNWNETFCTYTTTMNDTILRGALYEES
jgi:hypothetical protein